VLRDAAAFLQTRGIEHARLNAERLLGGALGCSRVELYLAFDRPLSLNEREAFKALLRRRAAHEPLQYILGETEFMSLPFRVTPDVLIPRPETEILVERVIEEAEGFSALRILDIGSGSGAIGIVLAASLAEAEVVCADVNPKALDVSRTNAERNGVLDRIRHVCANLNDDGFPRTVGGPFDVVVSNPPYVAVREWKLLPVEIRDFEPKQALLAGEDGLDFFRRIAFQAETLLGPGGRLFLEVGADQAGPVAGLLTRAGLIRIRIDTDLSGLDRVVRAERKPEASVGKNA